MGTKNIIEAIKENDLTKLKEKLDFFKSCLDHDYDLNQVVGKNEQRLLHIAVRHGCKKELLDLLLDRGADINLTNSKGNTPADYAVIYKQPTILEFLKNRADFSKKNNDGYTVEECIKNEPEKEKNISIDNSALAMLADVAIKQTKISLKRKNTEQKEIHLNKIQAIKSSFFHNLPRELECQSQPLDLTQNKPWNLSIPPCF